MADRTIPASQFYARLAGFMFLFYIATGIADMVLFNRAAGGAVETAAKLANFAQHATLVRLSALLTLLSGFDALVLAVALYAITRDHGPDLAMMALSFRFAEGVIGASAAIRTLGLLSVATASTTVTAQDLAAVNALGALLLQQGGSGTLISATCFAVGSTLFSWLFLRARNIPAALAWLGVVASVLLLVALPLRMTGFLHGSLTYFVWIPMAVFEVVLAFWLLIKGVAIRTEVGTSK